MLFKLQLEAFKLQLEAGVQSGSWGFKLQLGGPFFVALNPYWLLLSKLWPFLQAEESFGWAMDEGVAAIERLRLEGMRLAKEWGLRVPHLSS